MKNNMALADRIFRVVFAITVTALYFAGTVSGTLGLVLVIASSILLATSFINFCPIYAVLGLNFAKK
jgi:hypothetical protein